MRAVLRTQLGGVARRPARLLLTGLAVLVVSFVVYATVLAQQITVRSVLNGLSGTPEAVDLVIWHGDASTAQQEAIGRVPGVAETAGRLALSGRIGTEGLTVTADSGTGRLARSRLTSGRLPTGPGEIVVTPRTVDRLGLRVGSTTKVSFGFAEEGESPAPTTLTVVGTVAAGADRGFQAYAPERSVVALQGGDALDQIDVRLAPGADRAAVQRQVEAVIAAAKLPAEAKRPEVAAGSDVRLAEARSKEADVAQVFVVVGLFVAVAVVAAALVAASTFRIVFAQRMRQLALLRAVGAGRQTLAWSLAVEGALTGLVAGVAGVLLAFGAGHLLPPLLSRLGPNLAPPGFPLPAALGTVALAVTVTTLAVIAPAFSAARVSPLEALRGSATTGARRDIGRLRWAAGLLLTVAAGLLAAYAARHLPGREPVNYDAQRNLLAVVASGGLAFLALIALGPVLVRPVLAVLGAPVRRSGPVGRLAAGGVGAAPRRAAAVSVVVALGVTLTAGTLVGAASIRILADRAGATRAPADYELVRTDGGPPIPTVVAGQMRARPELAHVTPYRRLEVQVAGSDRKATDLSVGSLPRLGKLDTAAGKLANPGPGRVVISAITADIAGVTAGDEVTVTRAKRSIRLTVAARLADSGPLQSDVILDPVDLTRLGAPPEYAGVLADATGSGEQGRTDGRRAVSEAAAVGNGQWAVQVLADKRDEIDSALTVLLLIALGLIGLTVLIAVVGVGTTTALSVVERVRESGMLRAVGLSQGGLRAMLTAESALYGVIGAGMGIALGVPYAWLAVRAIGVNAPLTLPVTQLAAVFAGLVLLTAAAGALPARKAAKVSPVAALAAE